MISGRTIPVPIVDTDGDTLSEGHIGSNKKQLNKRRRYCNKKKGEGIDHYLAINTMVVIA